jgi:hypothetical protein
MASAPVSALPAPPSPFGALRTTGEGERQRRAEVMRSGDTLLAEIDLLIGDLRCA